jgi:hypothetical protein
MKIPSQDSGCPDRNSNRAPPEHKSVASSLEQHAAWNTVVYADDVS